MTTGATIHTTGGLRLKLKRRVGMGGSEMAPCDSDNVCVGASLDELSDVDILGGLPDASFSSMDEEELEQAKDLKEAAVVLGASSAGAKSVKSGSGGAKGEQPSIEGELLEAAVKEAEGIFAKNAELEKEAKKVSAVTGLPSGRRL